MGSHTWVRDTKKPHGGKTYAVGVAAIVPQQQPPPQKKRKLVWQRDASPTPNENNTDKTHDNMYKDRENNDQETTKVEKSLHGTQSKRPATTEAQGQKALGAEEAKKKLLELERLRKEVEERRVLLEKRAAEAKAAAIADKKAKEIEKEDRRRRIEAGFADAFAAAKTAAAADIAASKAPVSFADKEEVDRVLAAGSDYGVLKLVPGSDGATIRKRYRAMAVQLHPDKCKVSGADEAFHRLVKAYQQLSKYAR